MNRMKILIMALLVTACIKNGGEAVKEPLLKDFALKVNELSYHANLEQGRSLAEMDGEADKICVRTAAN